MIEYNKAIDNRFRIDSKKFNRINLPSRKELIHVHYSNRGHIEYTNSQIAIRLDNVYKGESKLEYGKEDIDPNIYPNLDKLFSNKPLNSVKLNIKPIEDVLEPFIKEKIKTVDVEITNKFIKFIFLDNNHLQNNSICHLDIKTDIYEPFKFTINPQYLYYGLRFFRLLKIYELELFYNHKHSPIFLTHENLEMIIMRIRNKEV